MKKRPMRIKVKAFGVTEENAQTDFLEMRQFNQDSTCVTYSNTVSAENHGRIRTDLKIHRTYLLK